MDFPLCPFRLIKVDAKAVFATNISCRECRLDSYVGQSRGRLYCRFGNFICSYADGTTGALITIQSMTAMDRILFKRI